MESIKHKYTIVLNEFGADALKQTEFSSFFVNRDTDFGMHIKCASLDPNGPFITAGAMQWAC